MACILNATVDEWLDELIHKSSSSPLDGGSTPTGSIWVKGEPYHDAIIIYFSCAEEHARKQPMAVFAADVFSPSGP